MQIDWKSFNKKYTRPKKGLFPVGSRVYIGRQGRGKTLSMVKYIYDLKHRYPNMAIFSNVMLIGIPYNHLNTDKEVETALAYQNGSKGVVVVLDEAHLYFGKKKGIPVEVLTAISQQRKDRRRIIFSSQIWNELDISIRKQVQDVVLCRNVLGRWQYNQIFDGESIRLDKSDYSYQMDKRYSELYKHNDEYYNRYDTYQKIITNEEYDRSIYAASPEFAVISSDNKTKKPKK
jgi:hypothetical protein